MASPLATAAQEIARELAAAPDPTGARERLAKAREKARRGSFAEKALAAAGSLLEGIADRSTAERFERLDLVFDVLDAVAAGALAGHAQEPTPAKVGIDWRASDGSMSRMIFSTAIVWVHRPQAWKKSHVQRHWLSWKLIV